MKPPVIVGIALAVVIIAAGVFAPTLRSSGRKTAEQAQERAELARRELARVSVTLPRVDKLADPAAMKEADLAAAVEAASETLNKISSKSSETIRAVQGHFQERGLPAPELEPFAANTAGVNRAISGFQTLLNENNQLLNQAISDAKDAKNKDQNALGVPQVLGMAEYLRAAGLLAEAEKLRRRQVRKQAELLELGAKWKLTRGFKEHFNVLDKDKNKVLAGLHADLEEIATLRDEAAGRVEILEAQAREREDTLQGRGAGAGEDAKGIQQRMQEARARLLDLEEKGFKAGRDEGEDGFNEYRRRYLELSRVLRELQEQEQELRFGGRPGAKLSGPDPATAEIVGGEPIIGLEEMLRQLATAKERSYHLVDAHKSLEARITYINKSGQDAQAETRRYGSRLAEIETQRQTVSAEIGALTTEALAKEDEALQAAKAAISAFGLAQDGAEAWRSAAEQLQQKRDPNRQNYRLKTLLADPYLLQVSQSAEAAARVLAGRIHALRVESSQRALDDAELLYNLNPDFVFDAEQYQDKLDAARKAGLDTLDKARGIYEGLSPPPSATSWVPLAALAAVHHLSARLDENRASEFLADALASITESIGQREHNPYLRPFVRFYNHLGGPTGEPLETEEEEVFFEGEAEGDFTEEDEGGFFDDEDEGDFFEGDE